MEALEGPPPTWEELSQMTGRELTAGAIAGLAEHSVMFPFDTIKTRLQQCPDKAFKSVLRQMLREEPISHLWRGITPALTAAVPAHAAYFSAYEAAKRLFTNRSDGSSKILGSQHACHALSAAIAVSVHDATTLPFDVVKQHMQVDTVKHTKMWPTFKYVLKRDGGVRRLYSSLPITITMNVPYVATHWMVYEELRKSLDLKEAPEGSPEAEEAIFEFRYVISGFLAGSCAAAVSNPFDVIKTNLQLDDRKQAFASTKECVRNLVKKWGYGVFLSGMIPRVVQLGPSAAIVMTSYEVAKKMLGG